MTRNFTTIAAALALFTATALPALAQSTPPSAPVSPAPATSMQNDKNTSPTHGAKSDEHASKSDAIKTGKDSVAKDAKDVKPHPQVAQQPGVAPKTDGAVKSDVTK